MANPPAERNIAASGRGFDRAHRAKESKVSAVRSHAEDGDDACIEALQILRVVRA